MLAPVRFFCLAVAGGLSCALLGAQQTTLTTNSPFGPAPGAAAPVAANETYELAAVTTVGTKTNVNIYDKGVKKGRWIEVGETSDTISVVSYDPAMEQAVVKIAGIEKTLKLRKSSVGVTATGAGPGSMSGGVSIPGVYQPTNTVASPQVMVSGMSMAPQPATTTTSPVEATLAGPAAAVANAAPNANANSTAKQEPPPAPGTTAFQEQEARMLVSDLLEIGIAQRRAYETAAKKAADDAAAQHPSGQKR